MGDQCRLHRGARSPARCRCPSRGAVLQRSRPWQWSGAKDSAAPAVGWAPRSTWPPTAAVCRSAWCSREGRLGQPAIAPGTRGHRGGPHWSWPASDPATGRDRRHGLLPSFAPRCDGTVEGALCLSGAPGPAHPSGRRGSRRWAPVSSRREPLSGAERDERCFTRLKQFRGLATRYAERAAYYRAGALIAAIILWLR